MDARNYVLRWTAPDGTLVEERSHRSLSALKAILEERREDPEYTMLGGELAVLDLEGVVYARHDQAHPERAVDGRQETLF